MTPIPELMTASQAAKFLGVCTHTITTYYKRGVSGKKLRAIKRCRRVFFERKDLEAFLEISEATKQEQGS